MRGWIIIRFQEEDSMNEELIIAMATAVILSSVKNETSKARLKKSMLKVVKTIGTAYIDDPDFQRLLDVLKT
jgi:hypothetical protein